VRNTTEDLQICFALVNDGHSPVNPEVPASHLLINGVEPKDWSFVIGNGLRNDRWDSLASGQSLLFAYSLGRYFLSPGVYRVRWQSENFEAPEITLRVVLPETITRDTEIMHGTPVFRGTRVPVQTLFDSIEGGETLEDFLEGSHGLAAARSEGA